MDMLCYDELTNEEKMRLDGLSTHPGFPVLKKLMEHACWKATQEVIKLSPRTERFDQVLAALQHEARAMNDFSSTLIKSIQAHSQAIEMQIEEQKEAKQRTPRKGLLVSQSNKGQ